ncbi:hypothetical protein [Sphingomonas sp. HMP9]|uniref:hypothetical protein n=1 Tax=Sphingomonas sp. HMP9 TaxID=1517554 RepID=UPI0015965570|nr:hypothetical protein [Sphingomonas sp. HMP9]
MAMLQERERLSVERRPFSEIDFAAFPSFPLVDLQRAAEQVGNTIFIEGLDTALLTQPTLMDELGRFLCSLSGPADLHVSVRVAVRSGIPCETLLETLVAAFGPDAQELSIAPLSEADVRRAARTDGVPPTEFVQYVRAVRAGPLAAQPATLRMLLSLWRAGPRPPVRREVLYDLGVRQLLRESQKTRRQRANSDVDLYLGTLDVEGRVAVASRIAAMMLFSGRPIIDLDADAATDSALSIEAAVGGDEPTERGRVEVRRTGVHEVVGTSLFRSEGGDRFAFAHPSLMDFLAARFLNQRKMHLKQIAPLIEVAEPSLNPIALDRSEVASWLAATNKDLFDWLVEYDPQIVLRSGIARQTNEERAKLARGLLAANAKGLLNHEELDASGDLVLISTDLSSELAGIVSDAGLSTEQRVFAASLAQFVGEGMPPATLLRVGRDPREPFDVRAASLEALA